MANQDILGTCECECCGVVVNLKRNKAGKAYYFCHGEVEEDFCLKDGGKWPKDVSKRIISVAAKHGGRPHFTKMKMIKGEPVVEIKQEKEIEPEEATEPEETETRAITGNSGSDNGTSDEWPYV